MFLERPQSALSPAAWRMSGTRSDSSFAQPALIRRTYSRIAQSLIVDVVRAFTGGPYDYLALRHDHSLGRSIS